MYCDDTADSIEDEEAIPEEPASVQSVSDSMDAGPHGDVDQGIMKTLSSDYDVIYYSDSNGMTRKVSEACEELWGLKPENLIGRSVFDLERDGIYKPSITRMVLETGRRIQSLQVTGTGRKLLVVGMPVKNKSGGIMEVVNLSWDLSLEKGLIIKEKNLSSLFNICDMAIGSAFSARESNGFVFVSEPMARVASIALKVSEVDSTVLITGESGVGKEVVASFIHSHSRRGEKPFIKINCAAIPEHLLESELFGYERGAFTGANREGKPGVFDLAEKGTLLLDEISEMSPNMQVKLLRVLQDGSFMRIGGLKPSRADVRIIAATNRDLELEMREGRFRQDLFYRLNVVPIHVPPLRERPDDIPFLAMFFLKRCNERYNRNKMFDVKTIMRFQEHMWLGNIRELQNIVERLVILTDGDLIAPDASDVILRGEKNEGVTVNRIIPLKDAVSAVEHQLISMAMKKFGTTTRAAEVLGVDQSTISRKIKRS